ncbi:hypothetical protein RZ76_08810 [Apilactobacillus kunkeei]|uniref:Uncharacterized protein n=1 Tax=Apilactobacillus kunkeei TaxID=148814 RepID=A0A0M9DDN8_9LACO|nr:hypothetical protein [Apilactobacillus kunkeei]KOY76826.1 hypothetical protein RZ71_12830 [Apilactobacillus kunkeei]KPN81867.1 hypothetical protein RZ76_08810 [Apilactobacillus kunkeei]
MNSRIAAIIISICEFFLVALYMATGMVYTFSDGIDIENAVMIGLLFFVLALCYLIQIICNFFLRSIKAKEVFLGILVLVLFAACMLTPDINIELVAINWIVIIANILNVMDLDLLKFK